MTDPNEIPAALREQLSQAGKARAKTFTKEHQSKAGKAAWLSRIRKAQQASTDLTDQQTSTPKQHE